MNVKSRPRIHLPLNYWDWGMEALCIFAFLAMAWLFYTEFSSLPEHIPVHFNFRGEPDRFGPRSTLILLPLIAVLLYVLLTLVGNYPHTYNYPQKITEENARKQYRLATRLVRVLKVIILLSFAYFISLAIDSARAGGSVLSGFILPVFLIAIFLPIAVYYWKSRQAA